MNDAVQSYFGIVVFELGKVDGDGKYYREDFFSVHADDIGAARTREEEHARELEFEASPGDDRSYVRLLHIVDVARSLHGPADGVMDIYARHFASLDTYSNFEMMLGGPDPLET